VAKEEKGSGLISEIYIKDEGIQWGKKLFYFCW
jgi:hypothetical protein